VAGTLVHSDARREARLSIGYYDKRASRDFVGVADDPNNLFWDDQKSLFLNLAYSSKEGALRGAGVGFLYMRKSGGLGEHWMEAAFSSELNDLTWESVIPYLKYDRWVSDKVQLSGYLLENVGREKGWWSPFTKDSFPTYDGTGSPFQAYDTQVRSVQGLLEAKWTIADDLSLTSGINVDTRRQEGDDLSYGYGVSADAGEPYVSNATLRDGSGRYTTYSAYAQLRREFPVLKGLAVTLGAREDYGVSPGQHYSQLSPRLGLVQKLTPRVNVRAFYGTALRAPGLKEVELNNESREVLQNAGLPTGGIVALKAETIKSLEVGAAYNSGNVAVGLSCPSTFRRPGGWKRG
jgi:outer membrane receptor protein involved in Fe transport